MTMMAARIVAACFLVLVAACQPQSPQPSQLASPARFEIRDFRIDEQVGEYGNTYSGRGTLVALDESLKKGNYLVWLTVAKAHEPEKPLSAVLILRDGLATVETHDYVSKRDLDKTKIRYTDWKMTGYVRFQEAVLVSEGAAPVPKK